MWGLVTSFVYQTRGHSPLEFDIFLFNEFLEWFRKEEEKRKGEEVPDTHLKLLFSKFDDIFAIVGEEIIILNTANTEAEDAFKCYVDQAEAGAADGNKEEEEEKNEEEGEYDPAVAKGGLWYVVASFIRSSTGEEPSELQHFYMSDLTDWLRREKKPESGVNLVQDLIKQYTDIFSTKDDDVWIEHLCSPEAQNAFEEWATED